METLGLYISVPFCRAKCTYCNFASGVSSPAAHQGYIDRLCYEIRSLRQRLGAAAILPEVVDSLYLGGGTPGVLAPNLVQQLSHTLHQEFAFSPDAEITLESAPGQLEDGCFAAMLELGVNRISFGVQSLVDREAMATGRFHTRTMVLQELDRMRAAGVTNLSIDLIAGLPHQTPASWQESLDVLASTGVSHASIYMLEIDEDSRLGRELLAGGARYGAATVPSEEQTAEFYETAMAFLPQHGLPQYEISNFAAVASRSRHNTKYWRRTSYVGFGLDAHSMLRNRQGEALRFNNPDALPVYLSAPQEPLEHPLSRASELEEAWFLGLRLSEGVRWAALVDEFGPEAIFTQRQVVEDLCAQGLLTEDGGTVRLTPRGVLLSNEVFASFLLERESQPDAPQPIEEDVLIQVL